MSRWGYFGRRLLLSVPVLVVGATLTFLMIRFSPTDPAAAIVGNTNTEAGQEAYMAVRRDLGLTKPLLEHYTTYMTELFTLQLGQSWVVNRGTSTVELLLIYGPRTLWLAFWAVLIPIFVGIPVGFYAGLNPNTPIDYVLSSSGIVWRAMPNFWLAVILLTVLSQLEFGGVTWGSLGVETTVTGSPNLSNLTNPGIFFGAVKQILPAAVVLGSASMGSEIRIARTAVLETINANYIEVARARGVPERLVLGKHVFRNALVPLVPTITNEAFVLVGGSLIVEVVFNINGVGYLFYQAAINGDLPLLAALTFVFILIVVFMNLVQDFLYVLIDPRVGYDSR
jgi:peptide/nickel transport system permease protein